MYRSPQQSKLCHLFKHLFSIAISEISPFTSFRSSRQSCSRPRREVISSVKLTSRCVAASVKLASRCVAVCSRAFQPSRAAKPPTVIQEDNCRSNELRSFQPQLQSCFPRLPIHDRLLCKASVSWHSYAAASRCSAVGHFCPPSLAMRGLSNQQIRS